MSRTYNQGWHSYLAVNEVERHHFPFYALIACAMKNADNENLAALKVAFPGLFEETLERYNNPMGMTDGERDDFEKHGKMSMVERYNKILKQIAEEFK